MHQHGPDEGSRLTTTSFGDADDVSAAKGNGDTLNKKRSLLVLTYTLYISWKSLYVGLKDLVDVKEEELYELHLFNL